MYDIIIIGAGTAGISAYKEALKFTKNILIINAGPWDTTCARVGCIAAVQATINKLIFLNIIKIELSEYGTFLKNANI